MEQGNDRLELMYGFEDKPSPLKLAYGVAVFVSNYCWYHHADAHYRGSFGIEGAYTVCN